MAEGSSLTGWLGGGLYGQAQEQNVAPGVDETKVDSTLGQANQVRNTQGQAIGLAQKLALGQGPSAAQAMLDQQSKAAMGDIAATASSGTGSIGQGAARKSALDAMARTSTGMAGNAAVARAGEQLGGLAQFGGLTGAQRGQDIQTAGLQGNIAAENAGLQAQTEALNTKAQQSNAQQNEGFLKDIAGGIAGAFMSSPLGKDDIEDGDDDNGQKKDSGLDVGTIMKAAPMLAAVASPPDAKDGIQDAEHPFVTATRQKFAGLYKPGMFQPEQTQLSPEEEPRFQQWVQKMGIKDLDNPESFYDYRGAFKAGEKPGPDHHWKDTYKQHGHPTFSQESKYSEGSWDGGVWEGNKLVPSSRGDVYNIPSTADEVSRMAQGYSQEPPTAAKSKINPDEMSDKEILTTILRLIAPKQEAVSSPPDAKADIAPADNKMGAGVGFLRGFSNPEGAFGGFKDDKKDGKDKPAVTQGAATSGGATSGKVAQVRSPDSPYVSDTFQKTKERMDSDQYPNPEPKSAAQTVAPLPDYLEKYVSGVGVSSPPEAKKEVHSAEAFGGHDPYTARSVQAMLYPQRPSLEGKEPVLEALGQRAETRKHLADLAEHTPQEGETFSRLIGHMMTDDDKDVGYSGSSPEQRQAMENPYKGMPEVPENQAVEQRGSQLLDTQRFFRGPKGKAEYVGALGSGVQEMPEENISVSSPPKAKKDVGSGKIDDALRGLHPYSYRYKDPANEPIPQPKGAERFFGIMTTDLKKHPVTRNMVFGQGKDEKISVPAATSFNLASGAHLQKKTDELEGRLSSLERMMSRRGR